MSLLLRQHLLLQYFQKISGNCIKALQLLILREKDDKVFVQYCPQPQSIYCVSQSGKNNIVLNISDRLKTFHSYNFQRTHNIHNINIFSTRSQFRQCENTPSVFTKGKMSCFSNSLLQPTIHHTRRGFHTDSIFTLNNPVFTNFLKSLGDEYQKLSAEVGGGKSSDAQNLRLHFLRPVVAVVENLQEKHNEMSELSLMITEEKDEEMKFLVDREMAQFQEEINQIENELVDVLVGEDLADNTDILLEVMAGVGGQEAMLFSAEVFDMYCNYARYKGWSFGRSSSGESDIGGTRKASVEISGMDVFKHLKHEAGVHRVQRVPKTEKQGRMHTSTITVSMLPQPKEIDILIDPKDLKIETMRSSGPGGQSVNTTDSAVRMTHLPTGTVSECRQERSQIKNKEIALKILKIRMYQTRLEEREAKRRATRNMQMGTRGRSEKIRTYNFQQDRISDHRLKGSCSNILEFMQGGEQLDDLIADLEVEEKRSSLASMLEEYERTATKSLRKS